MTNFEAQARDILDSTFSFELQVEKLAKLLESTAKEATRVERERCAKIVEYYCKGISKPCGLCGHCQHAKTIRNSQ